jgi:hypothetical protein
MEPLVILVLGVIIAWSGDLDVSPDLPVGVGHQLSRSRHVDPWADARAVEDLRGRLQWFLLAGWRSFPDSSAMVASLHLGFREIEYGVSRAAPAAIVGGAYFFSLVSAVLLRRTCAGALHPVPDRLRYPLLIHRVIFLTGGYEAPSRFSTPYDHQ